MKDVRVPDLQVTVVTAGDELADFRFYKTDRHPQDWEVAAALRHPDSKQAVRSCLLACLAELDLGQWEPYVIEVESGGSDNDQPQLPWS